MKIVRWVSFQRDGFLTNAVKLSRHLGMDCRDPEHMDVLKVCHPWLLDSGNPCRNDVLALT
jgi:hypothetical protein